MDSDRTISYVKEISTGMGLDVNLALAISFVESSLDTTKVRYEPKWEYLVNPDKYAGQLGITLETEVQLQKMSFGPLQIMGSNARSLGFNGTLVLLVQPQLGVLYGCRFLKTIVAKYPTRSDAISAYNAGHPTKAADGTYQNQNYVDKVTNRLNYLKRP
jgi:hypothetical protein